MELPPTIVSIRYGAFDSCFSISSFTFPYGSRLEIIERNGLSRLYKLKELYLPYTIKNIENESLACLDSLTDFYYCSSSFIQEDVFRDSLNEVAHQTPADLIIHVTRQYSNSTFGGRTNLNLFDNIMGICQQECQICTNLERSHLQYLALIYLSTINST